MARTVTRLALRNRIRQAADVENNDHVTDDEINDLINVHYPSYWDLLVDAGPPDLVSKSFSFTTTAGTRSYAISTVASDGDFYKLKGLFQVLNDGSRVPLRQYTDTQQWAWTPVSVSGLNIFGLYYPCCPTLTADTDTIEGYNGFEEYLVQKVAIAILKKRKEAYQPFLESMMYEESRIRRNAANDQWEPQHIIKRRRVRWLDFVYLYQGVHGYMLRGGNIELVRLRDYLGG